jgi:hypothetical protein
VTGESWKATCMKDTVCTNSMGELNVNSFVQQFAKGSFSNITTINQFKATVLQVHDECLFVILKLDTCFTDNLLMNYFPPVLRFLFDSSYIRDSSLLGWHCVSWSWRFKGSWCLHLHRQAVQEDHLPTKIQAPFTQRQRKIAKDLSAGNMRFRPHGLPRQTVTSGDGSHKCIQTLTLPILGLIHQQTINEISHTWRGLRSAVRGSNLWHTCSMTLQTLSQTA